MRHRTLKDRLRYNSCVRKIYNLIRWYIYFRHFPTAVEIGTCEPCNRRCNYCPVSTAEQKNRTGRMDERLFYKIISQLSEINFKGRLSFHFFNEPLLDKRLEQFVTYTRNKLPESTLNITTNGDLLSREKFDALEQAGIDKFFVSLHDEKVTKKINLWMGNLSESLKRKIVAVRIFGGEKQMMSNFASNQIEIESLFKHVEPIPSIKGGCISVNTLFVDYRGGVALCCNDFDVEFGHGNLDRVSLKEIVKMSYKKRKAVYLGRDNNELCKRCRYYIVSQ